MMKMNAGIPRFQLAPIIRMFTRETETVRNFSTLNYDLATLEKCEKNRRNKTHL